MLAGSLLANIDCGAQRVFSEMYKGPDNVLTVHKAIEGGWDGKRTQTTSGRAASSPTMLAAMALSAPSTAAEDMPSAKRTFGAASRRMKPSSL